MGPEFDALGVELVAISPDTIRESARGRRRSGLGILGNPDSGCIPLWFSLGLGTHWVT